MLKSYQRLFAIALCSSVAACGGGGSLPATTTTTLTSGGDVTPAATTTLQPYATAILTDAPTAYYELSDSGSTATDSSGHGLQGSVGSSVKEQLAGLTSSSSDLAMGFPGMQSAGGAVHVPAGSLLQPSSAVSLEVLTQFAATPADYEVLAGYGKSAGSASYEMYFKSGHVVAQFTTSGGLVNVVTPAALAINKPYLLDATFDGKKASLYLNGSLVASSAKSGYLKYVAGYGLALGDDFTSSTPGYKGTIDDVAVYAKALSATSIANHYAAVAAKPASSPGPTPTPKPTATPTPKPAATPTVAPTATPTATPIPVSSGVAMYQGCPVFTAGDYYNATISSAPVDPNSASYINSVVSSGDTAGFYASTGVEKVNLANNSTPLVTVKQQVSYHTFPVQYPWLSSYFIEPLSDRHAIVVQTQSCHLYESYGTTYSSSVLSAYSGANWNLTQPFAPLPAGSPSAMASGLSLFAGMVKWEDYQSGGIHHALNWGAIAHTVAQYKFVRPASDTDWLTFNGGSLPQLPYGAHLRLKASFNTSGWGPQAQMVAQAMKTYGIYLADTGSSANALYFGNAPDGSNPWNSSDLSALSKIHVSDFDVLTLPAIQTVPGH